MSNYYEFPQISPQALAEKLKQAPTQPHTFTVLDVREWYEIQLAHIPDERVVVVPMSRLAQEHTQALPDFLQNQDAEIIVLCHHGVRSSQVTAWLGRLGWKNVFNLEGGIDAYARLVDPQVGFY